MMLIGSCWVFSMGSLVEMLSGFPTVSPLLHCSLLLWRVSSLVGFWIRPNMSAPLVDGVQCAPPHLTSDSTYALAMGKQMAAAAVWCGRRSCVSWPGVVGKLCRLSSPPPYVNGICSSSCWTLQSWGIDSEPETVLNLNDRLTKRQCHTAGTSSSPHEWMLVTKANRQYACH